MTSIGEASMDADGTLRLRLRAGDDAVGDAELVYRPGDVDYAEVLAHLGGLRPGERKPVPPWPELPGP